MALLRLGLALLLSLIFAAPASAADAPVAEASLYDRPVLVVNPGMHTAAIVRASADRDGRWAVTGSDDKTVRIWSLVDGRLERTIRLPAGPGPVGKAFAVAISPDGALIAAGGWTRWTEADPQEQIYLFDRASGTLKQRISGLPNNVHHLVFSPDASRLAATLNRVGVRVYARDLDWKEVARDEDYYDISFGADFGPDGELATTSWGGRVRLYAAGLTGAVHPFAAVQLPSGKRPVGIAFSPDGARLAVGYADRNVVDLLDGRTLAILQRPDTGGIDNNNMGTVAWSRDGGTLLAGGIYGPTGSSPVLAWSAGGRRSLAAARDTVMSISALPEGDLLVAATDPYLARLGPDGTAHWAHGSPIADFRGQSHTLSVSANGMRVGFGYEYGGKNSARFDVTTRSLRLAPEDELATPEQTTLKVEHWENESNSTLNGKPLPLVPFEWSYSLAIHPAGDRFILGTHYFLRAFDAHGAPLWQRPALGAVWAVNITGDGRIVVAAYGDGMIRWHRMADGAELLAFMPLPNRRDWIAWTPDGYFDATEGAAQVLRWQVNHGWDQPATTMPVEAIEGYRKPDLLPLVLQEGEAPRALGLLALDEQRNKAKAALGTLVGPGQQLHLLAIGVGTYNDRARRLHLDYAAQDAEDFADKIAETQKLRYAAVRRQTLIDPDASKPAILAALATMREATAKGSGADLAVIFFSGHGVRLDGELFLLPHDVDISEPSAIKASGLAVSQLRSELLAIAANGRVLVLLDACHAGAATADGTPLEMDSSALKSGLTAGNITVITSSRGAETSREDRAWGHGAFTAVLLRAFADPEADINHDRLLNANGLANYLAREVPKLNDQQHPDMEIRFNESLFAAGAQ